MDTKLYTDYPDNGVYHCDHSHYDPDKPTIKDLLWYNYDWLIEQEKLGKCRPVVIENVQKTLLCNTVYLGYDAFECPDCLNINIINHHCHSRFCTSCGAKQQKILASKAECMCLDAPHRHIIFTIPEHFRYYFRLDRSALNLLFIAARNTICKLVNQKVFRRYIRRLQKKNKIRNDKDHTYLLRNFKDQLEFGMISSLHTFGRDLKWNPHIHALVCEVVYDPVKDSYKKFDYFNFNALRRTWQYEICRLLKEHFGDQFRADLNKAYSNNEDGFYVYAKKRKEEDDESADHAKNASECVNYMMRYASRPAMAQSRLVSFDKKSNTVSWFYNDHKTEQRVDVTEDARSLLKKMCLHIPEKNFRTVRYYGFYHNKKTETLHRIYELMGRKVHKSRSVSARRKQLKQKLNKLRFRSFCIDSYNKDVLRCSCGGILKYGYTYNPLEGTSNDRKYREKCLNEMRIMWICGRSRYRHHSASS